MKILVTGGAGYIGSVLVPELLKDGYDVRVVDTLWFGNHLPKECELCEGSILEFKDEWLDGVETIIHLAGLSNDPMAEYDPMSNYILNAAATAYLAQRAKEKKVRRFIMASTCSVYGFAADKMFNEDENPSPQYPYGISKLMAERALLSLMDTYFGVVILRKGTVGGYSPRMRYDLVVNTMTKIALSQGKIVVRNASLWRPVIDIRDVVEAYKKALKAEVWGIFNIMERNYTIKGLAEVIAEAIQHCGKEKPAIEIYDRFDLRNYRVSGQKASDNLGFKAKYSVEDTVRDLVKRIEQGGVADFDNRIYYNIEVFKEVSSEGRIL